MATYAKFKVIVRQNGTERVEYHKSLAWNYRTLIRELLNDQPGYVYIRDLQGRTAAYQLRYKNMYGQTEIVTPKM